MNPIFYLIQPKIFICQSYTSEFCPKSNLIKDKVPDLGLDIVERQVQFVSNNAEQVKMSSMRSYNFVNPKIPKGGTKTSKLMWHKKMGGYRYRLQLITSTDMVHPKTRIFVVNLFPSTYQHRYLVLQTVQTSRLFLPFPPFPYVFCLLYST